MSLEGGWRASEGGGEPRRGVEMQREGDHPGSSQVTRGHQEEGRVSGLVLQLRRDPLSLSTWKALDTEVLLSPPEGPHISPLVR